jgi:predicted DNA-binding protein
MSLISIRLPENLDAELTREAQTCQRPKSELAREAIVEYLARRERERFLGAIARAARTTGEDGVALAEDALPFDNEALNLAEGRRVHEPRSRYRTPRSKR